jgi:catechol 2,3-dioxygenase-like lactoylglutathione lyase family enzyme
MKSVETVMLPVTDQQRAKEFYLNLGYSVIVEAPMGQGETWLQMGLKGGGATISLGSFAAVICETENIQREVKELKSKGVEVGNVDDTPWGKFAWMKDPDGNSLCLREAK